MVDASTGVGPAFGASNTNPDAKKVLVYRLGSLGDMIVALPCLHLIQRVFPDSERVLLTNFPVHVKAPAAAEVLDGSGLIHGFMRYAVGTRNPFQFIRLALEIRRFDPDVVIYLMPPRSRQSVARDKRFFQLACGVRCVIGLSEDNLSGPKLNAGTGLYEAEASRLARTVAALGDARPSDLSNWSLHLTESERQNARAALGRQAGRAFIACGPGTKMQAKDWGQDNWRDLLNRLSVRYSEYGLVVIGAMADRPVGDFVLKDWKGPTVNVCGHLTPRETGALVEHASVFIGPDSGPMHLAACANVPCVIAFSARGLPGNWFPVGQQHKILYRKVSCFGCNLESCTVEKRRCLTSITVDEMVDAVESILSPVIETDRP